MHRLLAKRLATVLCVPHPTIGLAQERKNVVNARPFVGSRRPGRRGRKIQQGQQGIATNVTLLLGRHTEQFKHLFSFLSFRHVFPCPFQGIVTLKNHHILYHFSPSKQRPKCDFQRNNAQGGGASSADMNDDAAVGGEGGRPAVTDAEDDVKVSPSVGRHVGEIDSRLRAVGLQRTALQ